MIKSWLLPLRDEIVVFNERERCETLESGLILN
jgi:hypothetical protein